MAETLPTSLCDRCLGRRLVGAAGADAQRTAGAAARGAEVAERDCPVCEGAFADRDAWLAALLDAASGYEFATFQIGTRFPGICEGREREISAAMGQEKVGETIRTEANRWLAQEFAHRTSTRTAPEATPDLVLDLDTRFWSATASANSVFVRGRYNKHRRDIPQTHWPCRRCEGRGCWQCQDTGVTYAESVEDAIGEPAQDLFGASGYSFHGAGREDIDALMLGTGRPFVLELLQPRRRAADLEEMAKRINAETERSGVAVRDLRMAAKEEVAAIKEGEYQKEYLAHCITQTPVAKEAVEAACRQLTGVTLEQRTPERVSHRRADLVRRRRLDKIVVEAMPEDPGTRFTVRVLAESGTYIKEMASGDDGRTTPSLGGTLGVPTQVEWLDVVAILDGPSPSGAAEARPQAGLAGPRPGQTSPQSGP